VLNETNDSRTRSMRLPPAVQPAQGVCWEPHEGYRVRIFRDRRTGIKLPMLTASIGAGRAFDAFYELLKPLGEVVHVVLESSHGCDCDQHRDYRRNNIDAAVLKSHLCDYEELLVNDGCTGVAVLAARKPIEVQFDEHKIITVYAPDVLRFRKILKRMGVRRNKELTVVAEAEHLHFSTDEYADHFQQLATRIGVSPMRRVLSD
jgi:hypothetical protein